MKKNIIIEGECLQVMRAFPDNCIDLTVTSPPYDNLRDYKGYVFDSQNVAKQLYRITKEGGVVVWVVGDATINGSQTGTSFRQALQFMRCGFRLHDTMIYQKTGFVHPSHNRYHQTFQYMFIFSKGKPKTFNPIKDRKNIHTRRWGKQTARNKDGTLVEKNQYEVQQYGIRFNIWRISAGGAGVSSKDKIAHKHPAIFPQSLANDHIISWSNEGDLILDPFVGSGTTTKMAKLNNREYIGIDISKQYCQIARIRTQKAQHKK